MVVAPPPSNVEADQRPGPNPLARLLARATPAVMGVLNVTPDSFSDGGRFIAPPNALEQARRMISEGAVILDIGAESTRPYGGAQAVPIDEEMRRLTPVLPAVVALGVPVSIDTMKAAVADWALTSGAAVINDVWGLQRDTDMAGVAAKHGVPVIIMHNREHADSSIDIMADISAFFARSLAIAEGAGIARDQIVLDPGIGFGKTPQQSLIAIARAQDIRPAVACRRLAQALHRERLSGTAGSAAGRIDCRACSCDGTRGRNHSHP